MAKEVWEKCFVCGSDMCLFKITQLSDSKMEYDKDTRELLTLVICNGCLSNTNLGYNDDSTNFTQWFNSIMG